MDDNTLAAVREVCATLVQFAPVVMAIVALVRADCARRYAKQAWRESHRTRRAVSKVSEALEASPYVDYPVDRGEVADNDTAAEIVAVTAEPVDGVYVSASQHGATDVRSRAGDAGRSSVPVERKTDR